MDFPVLVLAWLFPKKLLKTLVAEYGWNLNREKEQLFILPLKNKLLKFVEAAYIVYKPL
jgi:hypothetical protein